MTSCTQWSASSRGARTPSGRPPRWNRRAGAESLDASRERWWRGLRDAEAAYYESTGQPFAAAEADYRRGFECALSADRRGQVYEVIVNELKQRYPDVGDADAFRRGHERGQAWAAGRRADRAA